MSARLALIFLLAPSGLLGWALRLLFWCAYIAGATISMEYATGLLEPAHVVEHASLILAVTAPLMLLVMWLTRHMVRMQEKLTILANRDPLTGVANRRAFFEAMENAGDGTILMIDADHFKKVNDTFGHAVGDQVLRGIAEHLNASTRAGDLVGRLGGEEFAIFLAGADEERAASIGDRIASGIEIADGAGNPIRVTLSVGGVHSRHADSVSCLVKLADEMLFAAKAAGRSRLMMWPQAASEVA